jgi:hypothetical protein
MTKLRHYIQLSLRILLIFRAISIQVELFQVFCTPLIMQVFRVLLLATAPRRIHAVHLAQRQDHPLWLLHPDKTR